MTVQKSFLPPFKGDIYLNEKCIYKGEILVLIVPVPGHCLSLSLHLVIRPFIYLLNCFCLKTKVVWWSEECTTIAVELICEYQIKSDMRQTPFTNNACVLGFTIDTHWHVKIVQNFNNKVDILTFISRIND